MIASSGVQADKADSVMDRYNRASNGVRALHGDLEPARSAAGARRSPTRWRRRRTPSSNSPRGWSPVADGAFSIADLDKRLRHFVRETARAPQAAAAFRDADRAALGELSAESQREADELLGNQIPETIAMARLAREIGAFGASSFGAGFGGSVWAAVPLADAAAFGEEWTRAYERKMPRARPRAVVRRPPRSRRDRDFAG